MIKKEINNERRKLLEFLIDQPNQRATHDVVERKPYKAGEFDIKRFLLIVTELSEGY